MVSRPVPRPQPAKAERSRVPLHLLCALTLTCGVANAQTAAQPPDVDTPRERTPTARSIWPAVIGDADGLRALSGDRLRIDDLEGRWILLDFWATWCAPCIAELPTLRSIQQRWPAERLLVLGVSMNQSSRATVSSWLRRQQADWPQLHDGQGFAGPVARALGVEVVPRTLLVDPRGRVVAVDLRAEELLATLEALVPL